jgi:hypothetical protein
LVAVLLAACIGCDDPGSSGGDAGPDGSSDTDADTDTDSDSDAGPDGSPCAVDPDRVFADVAFLASEELGGREAGSDGNELALQMAEERFAALGLVPVGDDGTFRQAFDFTKDDYLSPPAVAIDGDPLAGGDEYAFLHGTGDADVTAEIVYVGYGLTVPPYDEADYPDCPLPSAGYDDYGGVDVNGRIALVVRDGPDDDATVPEACPDNGLCGGEPCLWDFSYKAANADLHGAAAMLVVQDDANPPGVEHLASAAGADDFASVWVDRDVMEAAVPSLETWTAGIDAALQPSPHLTGVEASISVETGSVEVITANVLGAIPGTDPEIGDEVVIVGGHIDHLGNDVGLYAGADDNASGSAVVLELARLIAECATPARTIVFALWNAEEDGLRGSIHYFFHSIYPVDSTVAAFSVDMVGAGEDTNLVLYGAVDDANAWLAQVMAGSAADMGFDWGVIPGEVMYASDHAPFAMWGIPAVCAMSGALETHPYYHTPDDTAANSGPSYVGMSASMMYAGLKPLVEGTEGIYLTSDEAMLRDVAPARIDSDDPFHRKR